MTTEGMSPRIWRDEWPSEVLLSRPEPDEPEILDNLTLDQIVRRSAAIGCPYGCERGEFRQEVWFGLLEGRLDITELLHKKTLRKFWRDVWTRPSSKKNRHVSYDAAITREGSRRWSEVIGADEARHRIAGG